MKAGLRKSIPFIVLLAVFYFMDLGCIWKKITGLPCPGCGITRSITYALQGQFESAFYYHPLFLITIFLTVVGLLKHGKILSDHKKDTILWSVIGSFYIGVYIVRMIQMFPDTPPMDYNENSLIAYVFTLLKS